MRLVMCRSLRSVCERVRKSGRAHPAASLLRTLIRPEATGTSFERLRVARPQQHQHQTKIPAVVVASSPCIRALALACLQQRTIPALAVAGSVSPQFSNSSSSSTAEILPPCPEKQESFDARFNSQTER